MTTLHEPHAPLVYYATRDGLIKIGTTTRLRRRMRMLGVEQILAVEPGSYELEDERHLQFAAYHSHREWFRPEKALLLHVAGVRRAHELPDVPIRMSVPRENPADAVPVPDAEEIWLPIPGYAGLYDASSFGRVRSLSRPGSKGQILARYTPDGEKHPRVTLSKGGKQRPVKVHQLIALTFIGERPPGLMARHLDGNAQNNYASNLAYGTRSENTFDIVRHGYHQAASKTHCIAGHPFDEENTYVDPGGGRHCKACQRERTGHRGGISAGLREACPKGHAYDDQNTYLTPAGYRQCRTCNVARDQKRPNRRGRTSQTCSAIEPDGRRCTGLVNSHDLCGKHDQRRRRAERRSASTAAA